MPSKTGTAPPASQSPAITRRVITGAAIMRTSLTRLAVRLLAACLCLLCVQAAIAQRVDSQMLVHSAVTAGLRHHDAKLVWDEMQVGDALRLVREPDNPYDANAVRIDWNGHKLGYLPQGDNIAVARQLDRGSPLQARVARMSRYRNHRLKLEIDVFLPI
jgi:hypothetical protein